MLSYADNNISDEEFVPLYDCYRYRLAHALYIPVVFHCKQRSIYDGLEELCVLLRRTSYLCRISGMIQPFFQNQFLF